MISNEPHLTERQIDAINSQRCVDCGKQFEVPYEKYFLLPVAVGTYPPRCPPCAMDWHDREHRAGNSIPSEEIAWRTKLARLPPLYSRGKDG